VTPTEAAVTAATSLGIACEDPVVLHDGSNVVVHLRPAPFVARVATLTGVIRQGIEKWFARDALVARHLAGRGVPATRPFGEPVTVAGTVVALWHHESHDADHVVTPASVASLLAALHDGLADLDADLPRSGPCDDLARGIPSLAGTVSPSVLALLTEENERLRVALAAFPARPLHGDAHPGNLLATPSGLLWNDFEDAWLGPLGWDLACLANSRLVDGAAAVAAYPGEVSAEEVAVCVELRTLYGVVWRFVLARHFPHRRADAEESLRAWLASR
jgi:aminoglycoside phosphotransferase (APT) family kinase protein